MIDTGFTGFLMMPIVSAFSLALTLVGTSNYTLADGTTSPKLLAYGSVSLEGETTDGTIVLEPNSCGLLLGMDFLKRSKRCLIVTGGGVLLVHYSVVDEFGKAVRNAAAQAQKHGSGSSPVNIPAPRP